MALLHHPDRVPESAKAISKEKFAILHQSYVVLSEPNERKLYDEGNDIVFSTKATMTAEWKRFLKPVSSDDIGNARLRYQNSKEEQCAIKREYVAGKGSLTHMLNTVPFMRAEDESRVIGIIQQLINSKDVPAYKLKKIRKM